MTIDDYELYQMFPQQKRETDKLVYVGSGEDYCPELEQTINQGVKQEESYREIHHV